MFGTSFFSSTPKWWEVGGKRLVRPFAECGPFCESTHEHKQYQQPSWHGRTLNCTYGLFEGPNPKDQNQARTKMIIMLEDWRAKQPGLLKASMAPDKCHRT